MEAARLTLHPLPTRRIIMKTRITRYKGFVIVEEGKDTFKLYTKDEYRYGKGFRTEEWETSSLTEAKEFIDCY